MIKEENILLPGLSKQYRFLMEKIELKGKKALVIGSVSEEIAKGLTELTENPVELIVEDLDSFITSKLVIKPEDNVQLKMMDFDLTDFPQNQFDLIYAQGSVQSIKKNKIIKEIKRILKPEGILCVGELVLEVGSTPQFVKNIFENSEMLALKTNKITEYYQERDFEILFEEDLTKTLRQYYTTTLKKFEAAKEDLSEDEKKYYKKLLKKISHESGAFLKQGADKHLGFKTLICKRKES